MAQIYEFISQLLRLVFGHANYIRLAIVIAIFDDDDVANDGLTMKLCAVECRTERV